MPHRQTLILWLISIGLFLCIAWFSLGPLSPYCQLPFGQFVRHAGARIAAYLVFSSFLLEAVRRWWQKAMGDAGNKGWSPLRAVPLILAWVAILFVPVLFWKVGNAYSAASAAKENPFVAQIQKYELNGQARDDPKAMCRIGKLYEKGEGVSQNYQKAMQWYKRAAAMGYYPAAMADIGLLYQHGRGVRKNYGIALTWYRLGANARSARAMYHIGIMYDKGYGVSRSHETAVKWWRKAAAAGNPAAKKILKKLGVAIY